MLLGTDAAPARPSERPPRVDGLAVEARVTTARGTVPCGVRNLSLSGLFLERVRAPLGRELDLTLLLQGEAAPLQVRARVVRTDATGAGLVFSNIGWEDLLSIARFLAPRL